VTTILDNRRAELDARIGWLQQEVEALKAKLQREIGTLQVKLDRLQAERSELDNYVPAVDPETGEVR
jgi:uncharacterized small protein (DUF1192 family)